MALEYGKWDFVKRSEGKNMVVKSAYNSRSKVEFYGNVVTGAKKYDFSHRKDLFYHEILLPQGADKKFLDKQVLWNAAEIKDTKINSQPGFEGVLALPDDEQVSEEEKVELAKSFLNQQFVEKGLAVQLDIHNPDKIFRFIKDNNDIGVKAGEEGKLLREEEGKYIVGIQKGVKLDRTVCFDPKEFQHFSYREHNWHAHFLVTSRRFSKDGQELGAKARDITPQVRTIKSFQKAAVVEKSGFGKKWAEFQNDYFISHGLDLRVDPTGIVPQKHLGPVRMRGQAFDLLEEYDSRLNDNKLLCGHVNEVLEKITEQKSVFDIQEVDQFISKHINLPESRKEVKDLFWKQLGIVSLLDPKTKQFTGKFSTEAIVKEEREVLGLAERLVQQTGFKVKEHIALKVLEKESLKPEQQKEFNAILSGKRLVFLRDMAAAEKGIIFSACRETYTNAGYKVRGFAPDSELAARLKEYKFGEAESIYKFINAANNGSKEIKRGGEVWICDAASKLESRSFIELLKLAEKEKAQVIFCGDASSNQGNVFTYLQEKHGLEVKAIENSEIKEKKLNSKTLAIGEVGAALDKIEASKGFKWCENHNEAVKALFEEWAKDQQKAPDFNALMLSSSNSTVNKLNELARLERIKSGELSLEDERQFETKFGVICVSPGDKLQFCKKDANLGVTNGLFGVITQIKENQIVISIDQKGKFKRNVSFDPQNYNSFQLGYATANFRSQAGKLARCYVLDSPQYNKPSFYVALTKYSDGVQYFVSKDSVKNLTELKSKLIKENPKCCTLYYEAQIEQEIMRERVSFDQEERAEWSEPNRYYDSDKQETLVSQKIYHKGPIKVPFGPDFMRNRAFGILSEHESNLKRNQILIHNEIELLEKMTEHRSIFNEKDLMDFIEDKVKFVGNQGETMLKFWEQKELVSLLDSESGKSTGKFSSKTVIEEERALARVADKIYEKEGFYVKEKIAHKISERVGLNSEQEKAFKSILQGRQLCCLQGFAGTGKGRVLTALQKAYTKAGYQVKGFGPDNATAEVLKDHKFADAENIYRFTNAAYRGLRDIKKGKEVWICDEASKLGNKPLYEFLKLAAKEKAQVIFCGDVKQISSINRGGVFTYFQEKYGSEVLENIQRQKQEEQRAVSKALGKGEVEKAFGSIVNMPILEWHETKRKAIKAIFEEWSRDYFSDPQSKSLMIAHSNPIVNTLNELARIAKKERGEVSKEEEVCCETIFGKIYVSPGDKIQFRKKDFKLNITNGLIGVVSEVNEKKFTVLVNKGEKSERKIHFNPQKYNSFQLGYATTYFRSQGDTVDKCYVLDNPYLNKQNFYVGLTRHVSKVKYFVFEKASKSLEALKAKAMLDGSKQCTLGYITAEDLEQKKVKEQRVDEINVLKQSESFLTRAKGHFLGVKDTLSSGISKRVQAHTDLKADENFYKPKLAEEKNVRADVYRLVGQWEANQSLESYLYEKEKKKAATGSNITNKIQDKTTPLLKQESLILSDLDRRGVDEKIRVTKSQWEGIGESEKSALKGYFKLAKEASKLYQTVKTEAEFSGKELKSCLNFSSWQQTCAKRNEAAYQIIKEVDKESSIKVLGEKSYKIAQTLAARYEAILEKDNLRQQVHQDVKKGLEENVEALLYKLFPEGPASKTGGQMRFGSKGSLCVNVSGSKAGLFYDHENQEGGSLLKLIQKTQGLSSKEAKEWASSFLNIASEIRVPSVFEKTSHENGKESPWISLKPPAGTKAPSLKEINPGLNHYYKEEGRHSYKDEHGQLLYQVLRLRSKEDSSVKMTPPLSFGYDDENKTPHWKIKGFKQGDQKFLYNLYELAQNPTKDVLIVEGEKTADKALEKFSDKNLVCITWPGGAGAVSKADWTPLAGRNVIIWPDNDQAGFKAAEAISKQMGLVGAKGVRIIDDNELFKQLPKKWDLADEIPSGLKNEDLEKAFSKGTKQLMVEDVISESKLKDQPISDKLRVRDLFVHYHLKHADELFQRLHSSISYTEKEEILWKYKSEIQQFVGGFPEVKKEISSNSLINAKGEIADRLAYQILLFTAKEGKEPTVREINLMKEAISQIQKDFKHMPDKGSSPEIFSFAKDRMFEKACIKALSGTNPNEKNSEFIKEDISRECVSIQVQEKQLTQNLQVKQLERNRGFGLSPNI